MTNFDSIDFRTLNFIWEIIIKLSHSNFVYCNSIFGEEIEFAFLLDQKCDYFIRRKLKNINQILWLNQRQLIPSPQN